MAVADVEPALILSFLARLKSQTFAQSSFAPTQLGGYSLFVKPIKLHRIIGLDGDHAFTVRNRRRRRGIRPLSRGRRRTPSFNKSEVARPERPGQNNTLTRGCDSDRRRRAR